MDKHGRNLGESKPETDEISKPTAQRVVRSEELFCGERELIILHGEQTYRLMETRNGKLILQK